MIQLERLVVASLASACLFAAQAAAADSPHTAKASFPDIGYSIWTDAEPPYRLYPGDEVDIAFPSAPELNRSVTVSPDGRVTLPLVAPVMAADRTVAQLEEALSSAYADQLRHPDAEVTVKAAGTLKVFVGGEVSKPGIYDMAGDMDALRAIIDAGGFTTAAKRSQVVIIRRGPGGAAMMKTVDMRRALKGRADADFVPLRRFDIVYVPKSAIAEAGQFVQQYFRDLIPGQMGFNYSVGGQGVAIGVP